jgi:predicted Zn-dependent protease
VRSAARVYRQILADHPDHTSARMNLAAVLEETGDPSGAVDELQVALTYLPENPVILEELAQASAQAGDFAAALGYYRRASARTADDAARKRIQKALRTLSRRK